MSLFPANAYAVAREQCRAPLGLRDVGDAPSERLLQAIWLHQRMRRDQLQTVDGQSVQVLHPGFLNCEGGPDFCDALIRLGDYAPQRGDVEVDRHASGWRAHGHDRNKRFEKVILRVIWDGGATAKPVAAALPVLPLRPFLDAPVSELARWLGTDEGRAWPENLRGRCSAPLRELPEEKLTLLLYEAALVRLQSKAAQFQARARDAGWEQALWEGLFRGLGYKHNTWPMQALAETRLRWAEGCTDVMAFQARLLGLSGLLPAEPVAGAIAAQRYLRSIWDHWWRERDALADCVLPRAAWRLHGLRPANHPHRRLALAAHWLAAGTLVNQLQAWCVSPLPPARWAASLLDQLQPPRDAFWSWHGTLRSPRQTRPQPLLGAARLTDLAINVILPWLWMRAAEGGNEPLREQLETRYLGWPAAEDNAVLRRARQRLLGGGRRSSFRHAAAQQGLLQIVRDFCDHTNAVCDACPFPDVVRRSYAAGKPT
ncbi:MAG: DUF2851 family protein [Verrucomicrobia bacterium]|nr:DUF2851 family protein [Verrucomicrobiota bacterium]